VIEPDLDEQRTLTTIFGMHDLGVSVPSIVNRLDSTGVAPPQGQRWYRTAVYRVLRHAGRIPEVLRAPKRREIAQAAEHDRERTIAVASALREQGLSLRGIAAALLVQGLPPPRGGAWHARTLSSMLGYERP
jgi:hypothetical protein